MVILVDNDRFETMACAMAWAKRLGVKVECRSDEWLKRLRFEYEVDCGELDLDYLEGGLQEYNGILCHTVEEAKVELAQTRKYRPLGLSYEVEV